MQIELLKPHTNAGIDYLPGAVIELDDDLAQWLVATGTASAIAQAASKPFSRNEEKSK